MVGYIFIGVDYRHGKGEYPARSICIAGIVVDMLDIDDHLFAK